MSERWKYKLGPGARSAGGPDSCFARSILVCLGLERSLMLLGLLGGWVFLSLLIVLAAATMNAE